MKCLGLEAFEAAALVLGVQGRKEPGLRDAGAGC